MKEFSKGKIVFLGDSEVGKTAIINSYNQMDISNLLPTVAANSIKATVDIDGKEVILNLWDTAGQENYQCLLPLYIRRAHVGIIVFSLASLESYQNIEKWIQIFREQSECQIIVVGNKNDLPHKVDIDKVNEELTSKNYPFFQTSAKLGDGIELLFQEIAKIVAQDEIGGKGETTPFLPETNTQPQGRNGCCS